MRTVDPIRRGLRLDFSPKFFKVNDSVRTVDPIRRGLRLLFRLKEQLVSSVCENR